MSRPESVTFSFGENWKKYARYLNDAKIEQATESLRASFEPFGLADETFLDIGCGSGLFSLGAQRLGARSVTSVDIDPASVECTSHVRSVYGDPSNWDVRSGSALDREFLAQLPVSSRVYSWGVLHHTGSMWEAIENVLPLVGAGGALVIALYVAPLRPEVHMWLKRRYNRAGRIVKWLMKTMYACGLLALLALHRRDPIRYVREYGRTSRGMSYWRDVEDWLGGLPCEFSTPEEVTAFLTERGFETVRVSRGSPGGCAEYLLRRA